MPASTKKTRSKTSTTSSKKSTASWPKSAAKRAEAKIGKPARKPKAKPKPATKKATGKPVKGRTAPKTGKPSPKPTKPAKRDARGKKPAPLAEAEPVPVPTQPAKPKPVNPAKVKLWYVLCVEPGADGKVCKGIRKKKLIEGMENEIGRVFSPTKVEEKLLPKAGDVLAEGKEPEPDSARKAGVKWVWDHVGADEWSRDPNMPPPGYRVVIFPAQSQTKGKQGNGWQWKVRDERSPEERKCMVRERIFPGYVLVRMKMTPDAFHLVRSIRGVSYYLPTDASPTALETEEAATLLIQQTETNKKAKEARERRIALSVKTGDNVDVIEGVWKGNSGVVKSVSGTTDDPIITVTLTVWGRPVPVPLKWNEVVKS